ncbi:hypothetical protein P154DRAFT_173054 [Amniculicola lignicola CBS 123094]|uniref:PWWP domain-containing protein n=1 Tax=Amniculicola lignicola CBS 123094 TaxID=1392246 RepID=A0A6A5WK45_9PLEO|nr:hypothetical protein P154DRAFT_173054 [Amniculicola lignicola CBS 123094]
MAEEASKTTPVDVTEAIEETTRPATGSEASGVAEAKPVDSGDLATTTGEAVTDPKPTTTENDSTVESKTTADATADADTTIEKEGATADVTNDTPASKKVANGRRKSGAGIPEHKKKTPKGKKAAAELHLDVKPGDFWFVALRGYPPWPVVVCDEEMLPETLLSKRPVSAMRIDGTYRGDFQDNGKNAKDRRYPIMFMGTNEFAWQVNTDLNPLDVEEVKAEVLKGNTTKKTKALWQAYEIAAEGHDLPWFKDMLEAHEKATQADADEKAAVEAKKLEKKEKAAARKSIAVEETSDVEMGDAAGDEAASAKKAKPSKKRKAREGDDVESDKPAKTPKVKLTNKAKDASAAKPKKEPKPKKPKTPSDSEAEPVKVEEPQLTPAERLEKREKSVLYLRHRLQKGFLARDQAPKEEEMHNMSDYLKQLEELKELEAEIIKKTKVHKVLRAIIKLSNIPKDEEYFFKKRANDILNLWNGQLSADVEPTVEASASAEPATNGVKHDEEKKSEAVASPTEKTTEPSTAPEPAKTDGEGDVPMVEAKEDASTAKEDAELAAETTSVTEAVTGPV